MTCLLYQYLSFQIVWKVDVNFVVIVTFPKLQWCTYTLQEIYECIFDDIFIENYGNEVSKKLLEEWASMDELRGSWW